MKKHLKYLSYVILHKWYVFIECCKLGISWTGLTHDLSKFRPSEWLPYVNHFHGDIKRGRDKTGYYKPTDTGDKAFDFAWFLHQKRNKHHWQWWCVPEMIPTASEEAYEKSIICIPMDEKSRKEMLADWRGAGKAQGTPDTQAWYRTNQNKLILHPETRQWIEEQLL